MDGITDSMDRRLCRLQEVVKDREAWRAAVQAVTKSWTMQKAERGIIDAFELVLEKTLESPLDCKEIQPVHSKGDQKLWYIYTMEYYSAIKKN